MRRVVHETSHGSSGNTPLDHAADHARRVAAHLEAIRRALRESLTEAAQSFPVPLTGPQVLALERLVDAVRATGAGLSLSELSAQMGLAHSTASGIVTRLEQRGLVRRTPRPGDRRFVRIELTEPVLDWVADELPAARLRPLQHAMLTASDQERKIILGGLGTLERALARSAASHSATGPDGTSAPE